MTGSHIQTFPFLIRAITPVFSHLSPLFLGSNFASRCYLPCLLLIWQWSLQHSCPQWPLVKSLFTYNWCIQAINDDTQLALIGHVIACIVRKGFPSNRQTVWPQIERLPSAELGKFCWGGWEQLVLLWADNRSAPGREILPCCCCCCCCVDKLYDTAWRSFSPSRAVSVEQMIPISAEEHLLLLVDQFVYCWRLRAGLFLAALNLTPEGKTAGTLAHTNTYYDTHIDMY